MDIKPTPPPLFVKIMYGMGQAGWNLVNTCIMLLLIYFYIPPELQGDGEGIFPEFIERNTVFLSFTVVGLLMFVGTVTSAVSDIIMGPLSDRSKFKFGRRRTFLLIAFIPITLFTIMSFMPPIQEKSVWNALWLSVGVIGFNVFLSMYVTPYNGLIAELGHTQKDRVLISTIIAATWGVGLIGANTIFALKGIVASSFQVSEVKAFQYLILLFSALAMCLMSLPIFFVNEEKYCLKSDPVYEKPFQQMITVLRITNFRRYMIVEFFYSFSLQFLQLGIAYYVTTLLGLEEHYATVVVVGVAVFAFLSFPTIVPITEKFGKKNLLIFAFAVYCLLFLFVSTLGLIPLPQAIIMAIIILLASFPMAVFGILPMALVSDMATEDAQKTGKFRSATFFGVKFFVMKIGLSITGLLFPTFLLLGKSTENNLGVRVAALAGFVGCLIGLILMTKVKMPELQEEQIS